MTSHRLLATLVMLLSTIPLCLASESLSLDQAWARATRPSGSVGAAYLTITNSTDQDRAVVTGSASAAGRIELHTHIMEDDVMRMVEIPEIPLPAGEQVVLKPGDLHIMLYELESALRVGETFDLHLELDDGSVLEATVVIGSATARDFAEAKEHAHDSEQQGETAEDDAADCCGTGS
ncbi:MAG: copper chaperone PCu(A)C [Planctomycetota bacterium]|nr:MAG: copper chaperone PCu(A)C [Planctomycetota bacterium]